MLPKLKTEMKRIINLKNEEVCIHTFAFKTMNKSCRTILLSEIFKMHLTLIWIWQYMDQEYGDTIQLKLLI